MSSQTRKTSSTRPSVGASDAPSKAVLKDQGQKLGRERGGVRGQLRPARRAVNCRDDASIGTRALARRAPAGPPAAMSGRMAGWGICPASSASEQESQAGEEGS
jgi:hypothetical protein